MGYFRGLLEVLSNENVGSLLAIGMDGVDKVAIPADFINGKEK